MLDWLACVIVTISSRILCVLRPAVAVWVGERMGTLACWLSPRRMRLGLRNLRAAFDGQLTLRESRRIIHDAYKQLGAGAFELLRLPVMDRAYVERYVTIEGEEHLTSAIASGRPLIMLTAHYGNWELGSIVTALIGYPLVVVAQAQRHFPRLYQLLLSYRESKGCRVIHKGGPMRQVVRALKQRQPIGLLADQASRQGIFVELFGRPAQVATGPFKLARTHGALILPGFIRRVRGPYHHVVFESPIDLAAQVRASLGGTAADSADQLVRRGIEQFVARLSRHVRQDPSQWLWMHHRWKRTPVRTCLVLSDGKVGHRKQSLAVIEGLRERFPQLTSHVIEVRYRHAAARLVALWWAWVVPDGWGAAGCLEWTVDAETASVLRGRYADLVISCGASMAPVNRLWASTSDATSVVIMNPAPLPVSRFHLVIAPHHDGLSHFPNVIATTGSLVHAWSEETLSAAAARLEAHPQCRALRLPDRRQPVIALFVGGETSAYEISPAFTTALLHQVQTAARAVEGSYLVTTSRRTSPGAERVVAEQCGQDPRCALVLLASQDALDGTMEGMLGVARVAVVTGESVSMVSEACASGRHVVVVQPPFRQARSRVTKHSRFLTEVVRGGYATVVPVSDVSRAIQQAVTGGLPTKRLDNSQVACQAISRFL